MSSIVHWGLINVRKKQKTQSQTAGGQVCLGGENQRKERVGEGGIERRKGANLAACAESLKKTPNLLLGVGNQHLCCMCGYDGLVQQFYFPCGNITEGSNLL